MQELCQKQYVSPNKGDQRYNSYSRVLVLMANSGVFALPDGREQFKMQTQRGNVQKVICLPDKGARRYNSYLGVLAFTANIGVFA